MTTATDASGTRVPPSAVIDPAPLEAQSARFVSWAFVACLLLLALAALLGARSVVRYTASSERVNHTLAVLERIEMIDSSILSAVSTVRGYVITEDPVYLELRDASISELESSMLDLRDLVADSPEQLARIDVLEQALNDRRALLTESILLRQSRGFEAARDRIRQAETWRAGAAVSRALAAVKESEHELLAQRSAEDRRNARTLWMTGLLLLVMVALTILLALVRLRQMLRRLREATTRIDDSRRFLDSVIEHLPSMVFVKRADDSTIVTMNRACEELLGISREQIVGTTGVQHFTETGGAAYLEQDRELLASGGGVLEIGEEAVLTRTHGVRLLRTRKLAIPNADGQPEFIVGLSEDITDQRLAERREAELQASLERERADLQRANRELESFSYTVSHDLRSPLRAVDAYAAMLQEDFSDRLDAEGRRYVEVIRTSAAKLSGLIDDLLSYAQIGRQPLNPVPIDVQALVQRLVDEALAGRPLPHPVVVVGALPACRGDGMELTRVWGNLLDNAIKYSGKRDDARVEVWGERLDGEVVYHVRDNGVGFNMQFADKLFRTFQRLHSDAEFKGTGIGLAIVHRIVTRHGGRIWAEAGINRGATFHFTLPEAPATAGSADAGGVR